MLGEISKILSFLNPNNWSLKYWAILTLGGALLLLFSSTTILPISIPSELRNGQVTTIAIIVTCISTAGFLVNCIEKGFTFWKKSKAAADAKHNRQTYLFNLTVEEKQILCGYVLTGSKTQIFKTDDGVVNGLVQAGIIYRAAHAGTIDGFPYNINEWAWEYLKVTEFLITEGVPTDNNGSILPYENSGSPLGQFLNKFRR